MSATELQDTQYRDASMVTADNLITVATRVSAKELSQLALPEIERLSNEVARVVPAGNVPGIILSGLTRLEGRTIDQNESQKHIDLLFRGVRQSLDRAIYSTFFAGPAAVLYGYQMILKLAGKDPEAAFKEGTWQFYLEFALREDTARHANETDGFHKHLTRSQLSSLTDADQLAAWLMAALETIHELPEMLANEWRERMVLRLLQEAAPRNADDYARLYRQWETQRPYKAPPGETYAAYRRRVFDDFWKPHYDALNRKGQKQFDAALKPLTETSLPAYQQQMSWLAYLEPGTHREGRVPYDLRDACIGVISGGRYYLVPLSDLKDIQSALAIAGGILKGRAAAATLDDVLVSANRAHHAALRKGLPANTRQELDALRRAPVLLNWDVQDSRKPLAAIRRAAKRGIGDHALTLLRTDKTFIFDQSHIFFDGAWGAIVAEVMTNKAIARVDRVMTQPDVKPVSVSSIQSLTLKAPEKVARQAQKVQIRPEACAENTQIRLSRILSLRRVLKQRSDLTELTVNDLFILYRALHSGLYKPAPELQQRLNALAKDRRTAQAYQATLDSIEKLRVKNPAILIPIDASRYDPRERVFPTTFRNPLTDLYGLHHQTLKALNTSRENDGRASRSAAKEFRQLQLTYLRMVGGFGQLLSRYKEIALQGQSTSTATIKFLAHMPDALQSLLNNIPGRFDVLNEVIKGEEVFSNVGQVAKSSTLRRFITAKDDNEQKTLAWGVLTDADGVVHLSLRDFRPHVAALHAAGQADLADLIAQDYLDSYVVGFNRYTAELREITTASESRKRGLFG